ncbi:hypothetical protein [Roseinatronobacter thiooxidans]|uniref:hypothetical protein n=1 Tax=Roseinatronobacter thiooxidans TaxID=121821 RepID=UPI000DAD9D43|nr:hypothetical protein [Roseinatronobacter thiooxidans]
MIEKIKITVVGLGYVGMCLSVLFGRTKYVVALDIDAKRLNSSHRITRTFLFPRQI